MGAMAHRNDISLSFETAFSLHHFRSEGFRSWLLLLIDISHIDPLAKPAIPQPLNLTSSWEKQDKQ